MNNATKVRYQGINSPDELVSYQVAKSQTYALVKSEFSQILYKYTLSRMYTGDQALDWLLECNEDPRLFGYLMKVYFKDKTRIPENYDRKQFEAMLRGMSLGEYNVYIQDHEWKRMGIKIISDDVLESAQRTVKSSVFCLSDLEKKRCISQPSMECKPTFSVEASDSHESVVETWARNSQPEIIIYAPPHSGKSTTLRRVNTIFGCCPEHRFYDTDDILSWDHNPRRVFTNVPTILKYGAVSFSFLPSKLEFFDRCGRRNLVPEQSWYDGARYHSLTYARTVLSDSYLDGIFSSHEFIRPTYGLINS